MDKYLRFCEFILDLLPLYHDNVDMILKYKDKYYNKDGDKINDPKEILDTNIIGKTVFDSENLAGISYINLDKTKDDKDIYFTIAHELRHLYQLFIVYDVNDFEFRNLEKDNLINWKCEIENYKTNTDNDHENQIIEIDSNAFANLVIKNVFGVEKIFNSSSKIRKKMLELENDYADIDIRASLAYSGFVRYVSN